MPKGDATYPTMTLDECLAFADEWSRGITLYPGAQGWRVVCMLLAEEVREQRAELNEQCRLLGMGASREARLMARMTRMVDLMRKLREPDWHIESIREFQRELTALENAAMSDDSALREMIEAAKAEERERVFGAIEQAWYAQGLDVRGASISDFLSAIRARKPDTPSGLSERVMTVFAQMQAVSHGRARKG